jgi:hypothetical protein
MTSKSNRTKAASAAPPRLLVWVLATFSPGPLFLCVEETCANDSFLTFRYAADCHQGDGEAEGGYV